MRLKVVLAGMLEELTNQMPSKWIWQNVSAFNFFLVFK